MNSRKIVIRAALVVIGLPIVLVLLAFAFFYSVFYFPNWTSATTGTVVFSGEKREYLLYASTRRCRCGRSFVSINLRGSNLGEGCVERRAPGDGRGPLSYLGRVTGKPGVMPPGS